MCFVRIYILYFYACTTHGSIHFNTNSLVSNPAPGFFCKKVEMAENTLVWLRNSAPPPLPPNNSPYLYQPRSVIYPRRYCTYFNTVLMVGGCLMVQLLLLFNPICSTLGALCTLEGVSCILMRC